MNPIRSGKHTEAVEMKTDTVLIGYGIAYLLPTVGV